SYGLKDIAILYRFHAQARLIEQALERAGLPYQTYGKKAKKNGQPLSIEEDLEDFRDNAQAAPSQVHPGETISLMTLHRAKGLEFPVVFMVGCEEGVLPGECLEEDRRLFYVGMTRARSRLFLSHAKERFLFGKSFNRGSSQFLHDIEKT